MTTDIRGAKGGGSTHTPTESPDNLRSIAYFRILDLVSEGEIGGLVNGQQSIYLDETPMANPDGSLNFPKAHIEQRTGTPDQTVIPGFDSTENEIGIGVELKAVTPWVRSITNPALDAIRVTLGVPALSKANTTNGDITGYTISYKIELQTDGGAYQQVYSGSFTGKTTTKFQRSHRIDLPTATTGWQVRVTRLTANANSSAIQDTTTIDSYTEIVDSALAYPNSALMGVMGDASQFTNIPQRAYDLWGRIIQVPSNYDVTDRSYAGVWDGTFKPSWSDNPAWVFYDLCTNTRYGLGHLISPAQVDKWELYRIGQYCDGMVDDGQGGTEPRFACNVFLQTQADAYKLLNDLSSAFRGISYWANGTIVASADMPGDPVYPYTNANVIDGKFSYSASARKTRYTSALVSWNDPRNFYRTKIEYVEDADGIARYGFQQATATAFGCTSQGQAQRFGKWLLLTSRLETDTVTFSVGLEGTVAAPGQIITVADAARAGKRQGGRVHSATTTTVTVDAAPTVAIGDTLTVVMPDGVSQTRTVSAVSGNTITVSSAFTSAPLAQSAWTVESATLAAQTYRVLAVTEDKSSENISFTITALQHNASKFSAVETGTSVVVPPISALKTGVQSSPLSVTLSAHAVVGQVATYSVLTISWEQAPGAIRYEVEWRRDDGEWKPVGTPYGLSVDVVGVSAGTYTARVRAVARDGNASLPRQSDAFVVGDASTLPTSVADISGQAADAQAAADAANAALADIASDGILSPVEKPTVIRDNNVILTEQAGIDAQATAYGITTEKTAYDNKVSALTVYLASLTTPVLWSDLSGNTTIVGATFRAAFADVYTTRQALLNAIYAAAKAKADTAKSAADAAQNTADTATAVAVQVPIVNPTFDATPAGYGWVADAGSGWVTDMTGITPGGGTGCAKHVGGSGAASGSYRNIGRRACQPGQIVRYQALIKAIGANGYCTPTISFQNAAGTEITSAAGALVSGTQTQGVVFSATAPAGTVAVVYQLTVNGHTAGTYLCDNCATNLQPTSLDEIPDGAAKFGAVYNPATQAQQAAQIAASYKRGQNVVPNPCFALAFAGGGYPGWSSPGSGWSAGNTGLFGNSMFATWAEHVTGSATPITSVLQTNSIPFPAGAAHSIRIAYSLDRGYSGGNATADVQYLNASGSLVLDGPQLFAVSAQTDGVQIGQLENQVSPAGTAYIRVRLFVSGAAETGGPVYYRVGSIKVELGPTCTPFTDEATQYGNQLTNPGSGQTIGDQRNLVSSITRNLGITRSATALTANAGGAVDINAHVIQMGGASVGYSAKTNAVTGLATSASYYIYTRDNYAGGSPTWAASNNQNTVNSYDDAYNAGVVTIPTSGSSGGGAGGGGIGTGGCVVADMYLRPGLTARQLAERWRWWRPYMLRGPDGWHFVRQRPRIVPQLCCRITVADGSTLDCSLSTPVTVRTGESILAPMVYGHDLWTDSGWQRVINVELLHELRDVVRISVGGHSFLAGADPYRRISTHNAFKP